MHFLFKVWCIYYLVFKSDRGYICAINIYKNNSLCYKVNFKANSLFEDYCTSCHYCAHASKKIIFLPIIVYLVRTSIFILFIRYNTRLNKMWLCNLVLDKLLKGYFYNLSHLFLFLYISHIFLFDNINNIFYYIIIKYCK